MSLALSLLDTSEHLPTTGTHPHWLNGPFFLCFGGFLKGSRPWTSWTLKQRNHASLILLAHATMAVGVGLMPSQGRKPAPIKYGLMDNWTTKLMQHVASSPLCRPTTGQPNSCNKLAHVDQAPRTHGCPRPQLFVAHAHNSWWRRSRWARLWWRWGSGNCIILW